MINIYQDSFRNTARLLFGRVKKISREKGISYVVCIGAGVIYNWPIDFLGYWYYKVFKSSETFTLNKITYNYFYHRYNSTWKNERVVEIPIIWRIVEKYRGQKILEVGNVLSHYFPVDHDILDKYEKADGVFNHDIIDFSPTKKYDLIVSISTLEHVGWDENPRMPMNILKAFENLFRMIAPNGKLVVTLPIGYNTVMDELLRRRKIQFTNMYCLKRMPEDDSWVEVDWDGVQDSKYDPAHAKINGLIVGIIENR